MSEPTWEDLFGEYLPGTPPDLPEGRPCTPKCGVCGRFTKHLTLVWTGGPEPEPDYEVGDCCRRK